MIFTPWGLLDDLFATSFDKDAKAKQSESAVTKAHRLEIERILHSDFLSISPLTPIAWGSTMFPKYNARMKGAAVKQAESVVARTGQAATVVGNTLQTVLIFSAIIGAIILIKELK